MQPLPVCREGRIAQQPLLSGMTGFKSLCHYGNDFLFFIDSAFSLQNSFSDASVSWMQHDVPATQSHTPQAPTLAEQSSCFSHS